MKNRLLAWLLICCMAFSLTGCGEEAKSSSKMKKTETAEEDEEEEEEAEEEEEDVTQKEREEETEDPSEETPGKDWTAEVSFASEKDILSWIAGEWKMIDSQSGADYVTLEIGKSGSCTFTRLKDKAACTGEISFDKMYSVGKAPDECCVTFRDFGEWMPPSDADYPDEFTSSGIFHLGSSDDRDYMYLSEVGNGDTWASIFLLNPNASDHYGPEEMTRNTEWVFYREQEDRGDRQPEKDASFYGWVWEMDPDGSLLVQKMDLFTWDDTEEYTNRVYTAGYFAEQKDIGITRYTASEGVDLSRLGEKDRAGSGYPLDVCSFTTDADGRISAADFVEQSYYHIYDLGDRAPQYSFEGMTFVYNDAEYDLRDYASPAVNAIMEATQVGDWIILDCHINPNIGAYEFFYIPYGSFAFEIVGANLTWQGTDLSTAVYSAYTGVYDLWGNLIYNDPAAEIYGLEFTDSGMLKVNTWWIEGEEEKEETREVEYEQVDRPMFLYLCYLLSRRDREWRAFLEEAPENAASFVMVNPPEIVRAFCFDSAAEPVEASEELAVVFLEDGDKVHIESTGADTAGTIRSTDFYTRPKGNVIVFSVTVPEGLPQQQLVISSADHSGDAFWPILQISGMTPQRSEFVLR